MQASNPLVPPQLGSSGGAPAPVANAPNVPESGKSDTRHPVSASKESERTRSNAERPRGDGQAERREPRRGERVDITV